MSLLLDNLAKSIDALNRSVLISKNLKACDKICKKLSVPESFRILRLLMSNVGK